MAEENERPEEKKQSSASRVANDINNARTDVRRLRRLREGAQAVVQTGRAVISAVQVALATSEIWVPIFVVLIIIFSAVIILVGAPNVNAGNPGAATLDCVTDLGGICSADATCNSVVPASSPDTTGAVCTPATSTCCVPKNDCGPSVVCWAKKINDVLQPAIGCATPTYNRLETKITNGSYSTPIRPGTCDQTHYGTYFCTDTVIDSNNLAGINNNLSETVGVMIYQWSGVPGLVLQRGNDVRNVKPGDAIFWFADMPPLRQAGYHTDVVYRMNISAAGNGYLYTLDSNVAGGKIIKHTVIGWAIQFSAWLDSANKYAWFGLHN